MKSAIAKILSGLISLGLATSLYAANPAPTTHADKPAVEKKHTVKKHKKHKKHSCKKACKKHCKKMHKHGVNHHYGVHHKVKRQAPTL